MQTQDSAENGFAFGFSTTVLRYDTWPDLYFLTKTQNTSQNRSTSNTALQFIHFSTRFVDVKGTDDDKPGIRCEVTHRNGDALHDILIYSVDVVFKLSGNRDDGRVLSDSTWSPMRNFLDV